MSQTNFEAVRAFHERFNLPRPAVPTSLASGGTAALRVECAWRLAHVEGFIKDNRTDNDVLYGRVQMMLEELREFVEAYDRGILADQADSLVDLVYFALGTGVMMGLPWERLFTEVQRANMDKIPVESKAESSRLNKLDVKKPAGWQPPNIAGILATP